MVTWAPSPEPLKPARMIVADLSIASGDRENSAAAPTNRPTVAPPLPETSARRPKVSSGPQRKLSPNSMPSDKAPVPLSWLEPPEFTAPVADCKAAWRALGRVRHDRAGSESGNLTFRRSLYVVADVAAGEVLTPANVRSIRPGFGLPPKHLPAVLGRTAARALRRGERLSWDMLG